MTSPEERKAEQNAQRLLQASPVEIDPSDNRPYTEIVATTLGPLLAREVDLPMSDTDETEV